MSSNNNNSNTPPPNHNPNAFPGMPGAAPNYQNSNPMVAPTAATHATPMHPMNTMNTMNTMNAMNAMNAMNNNPFNLTPQTYTNMAPAQAQMGYATTTNATNGMNGVNGVNTMNAANPQFAHHNNNLPGPPIATGPYAHNTGRFSPPVINYNVNPATATTGTYADNGYLVQQRVIPAQTTPQQIPLPPPVHGRFTRVDGTNDFVEQTAATDATATASTGNNGTTTAGARRRRRRNTPSQRRIHATIDSAAEDALTNGGSIGPLTTGTTSNGNAQALIGNGNTSVVTTAQQTGPASSPTLLNQYNMQQGAPMVGGNNNATQFSTEHQNMNVAGGAATTQAISDAAAQLSVAPMSQEEMNALFDATYGGNQGLANSDFLLTDEEVQQIIEMNRQNPIDLDTFMDTFAPREQPQSETAASNGQASNAEQTNVNSAGSTPASTPMALPRPGLQFALPILSGPSQASTNNHSATHQLQQQQDNTVATAQDNAQQGSLVNLIETQIQQDAMQQSTMQQHAAIPQGAIQPSAAQQLPTPPTTPVQGTNNGMTSSYPGNGMNGINGNMMNGAPVMAPNGGMNAFNNTFQPMMQAQMPVQTPMQVQQAQNTATQQQTADTVQLLQAAGVSAEDINDLLNAYLQAQIQNNNMMGNMNNDSNNGFNNAFPQGGNMIAGNFPPVFSSHNMFGTPMIQTNGMYTPAANNNMMMMMPATPGVAVAAGGGGAGGGGFGFSGNGMGNNNVGGASAAALPPSRQVGKTKVTKPRKGGRKKSE